MAEVNKLEFIEVDEYKTQYNVFDPSADEQVGHLTYDSEEGIWYFDPHPDFIYNLDDLHQIAHKLEILNHPEDMEFVHFYFYTQLYFPLLMVYKHPF